MQWSHADFWGPGAIPGPQESLGSDSTSADTGASLFSPRYHEYLLFFHTAVPWKSLSRWHLLEPCVSSPGVVAAVLGAAGVLLWAVGTLPFVGAPLGTEVATCAFAVLFTDTGLAVGSTSEWGWASSGCPGFSVFPGAAKSCAMALENVASTDGSGADVPVWICKGKSCLSLSRTLNVSFKLPFSSSTVREDEKCLACFSRSKNFYCFLFSLLKCFSMFFLHSRQAISTPAEHQLTPDLATAFKYQGCWCGKCKRRSRFKTAVSGAERTERWGKTDPKKQGPQTGVHLLWPWFPFPEAMQLASTKHEDCSGIFM